VALIQDITEQHRYEQALRESQDRLQLVIGASKLGLWDWNVSTGKTYLSPEWKHQLGYRDDELAATYDEWYSRLHPDDRQRVLNSLQEYLDGHSTEYAVEYRIQHKDRSYRWVHSRGIALYNDTGQPTRMLGCQLDFTEQKRTEETLRHILQSVTAETGQAYFSQLTDYLTRVCNVDFSFAVEFDQHDPNLAKTVAYSYQGSQRPNNSYQLKCTPCELVLHAGELTYFPCDVQQKFPDDQMLVNERIHCFMGVPLVSSSGQSIGLLTLLHTGPLMDAEQAKTLLRVVAGRSSAELERHQAEVAVRTSEQTLSKIAATMPHALYIFDLATQSIVYRNREVARELGYREDQISAFGDNVLRHLLYPDDYAELERRLQRWQTTHDGQILENVYRMRHASGEYRWFNCRSTVYERAADGRVTKIIGTTQDISERKQAEEDRRQMEAQMQHAQKLESLGVLAGGIAHDFNNLLATILGYTELALQEVAENPSAKQYLAEAVQGVNSATDLTRQLLAYSGKGRIMAERTDLSTLVTETSRLLDVSISKKCTLNYQLDPHLPACEVDIGQIRQVIMNLIINASEAIGDDIGVISIHTYARKFHKSELESLRLSQELQEGEFVVLDVSDTGCGIAADMQKKLFDPFFSTKFAGRGLGLAAVQGIIHTHGGAISVESQLHQGAKFRVLLPASDKPVKPKTVRPEKSESWQGQGTVLIADDEETVLKLTDRMVRRLGFQTIIATDGEQAVSQFQNHADEICVVLLDVTMPKLDGLQVLSKIRDVNPQTPV
ncbi:MAG: PAS domain-containing protein, partial [Planctomycetales bacterium]|nr:PAS domain-containing protein [Planctomycetales bacterium]